MCIRDSADWAEFAVAEKNIVTGQNPSSGAAVAREVLKIKGIS